ncbi:MAG: glycosyltransferase family 39 protein, partial [Bacteroidota bacterium]
MKNKNQLVESNKTKWIPVVVFSFIYILLYTQLITKFFINVDDDVFFTNNPHIKSLGFDNIVLLFSSFYGGNYHPITSLLEAIQYAIFGMNPTGFHFISFLFHFINCVLVYHLVKSVTDKIQITYLTTFIFAFHPMHVETVAWITDQTDVFCTTFSMLSLIAYVSYLKDSSNKRLGVSIFYFLLAVASKPSAIAIPPMLFAFDYLLNKNWKEKLAVKIPYFLIALLFASLTFLSLDAKAKITELLLPDYTPVQLFFVSNYAFAYYIINFFFPFDLSAMHLAYKELPILYYAAPLFNALMGFFIYKNFEKDRMLISGFLFFVFSIVLVLQILPSGYNIVAERYTYIPFIGLSLMLGSILYTNIFDVVPIFIRNNLNPFLIGFAVMFIGLNFSYGQQWTSLVSFNKNIAEHNTHSSYAQVSAGYFAFQDNKPQEALDYCTKAEQLDNTNSETYFLKSKVLYALQEKTEALKNIQLAQKLKCTRKEMNDFLSILYFENNQYDSAIV